MPRTIVDIPDPQLQGLDELCTALNISRAEAVRRAIDQFVKQESTGATEAFGAWKGDVSQTLVRIIAELKRC